MHGAHPYPGDGAICVLYFLRSTRNIQQPLLAMVRFSPKILAVHLVTQSVNANHNEFQDETFSIYSQPDDG